MKFRTNALNGSVEEWGGGNVWAEAGVEIGARNNRAKNKLKHEMPR